MKMGIMVLPVLAFFVPTVLFLADQALGSDRTKLQFNSATLSTSVPRYLRQGHRSYVALVRCEQGDIRLQGTRSEKTELSVNVLSANLPGKLPKTLVVNATFYSSGTAIMKKGQYYIIVLTENQKDALEAHPFGFIDFSVNNQAYRLTDYFATTEKEAQPAYDKTLQRLNQALENVE